MIDSRSGVFAVADNHSFDIVSEINHAEMHNAVAQAQHEIAVRYDFKGTKASIDFNKKENTVTILSDHKGQLESVLQTLKEKGRLKTFEKKWLFPECKWLKWDAVFRLQMGEISREGEVFISGESQAFDCSIQGDTRLTVSPCVQIGA